MDKMESGLDKKFLDYQTGSEEIDGCTAGLVETKNENHQKGNGGIASDKPVVNQELHHLQNQLSELKRKLDELKTEHELMIVDQKKLFDEFNCVLKQLTAVSDPHGVASIAQL